MGSDNNSDGRSVTIYRDFENLRADLMDANHGECDCLEQTGQCTTARRRMPEVSPALRALRGG